MSAPLAVTPRFAEGASAPCVAVAYSGGRDSTALLHATRAEAASRGLRVLALHVHHGLHADADAWLVHAEAQCARWSRRGHPVEFIAHRLQTAPARGDSVEAWARTARFRALRSMAGAHGASIVLLAQHRRDQAETWLLQALRGGGTAGLSGMPARIERDGIAWCRPWLDRPREAIEAYVRRHRLNFVDDGSNADPRFMRNRLRLQVWPHLSAAFPGAEAGFATASRWAREADAALAELAEIDLAAVASANGLDVPVWLALSTARRSNALRAWLHRRRGTGAPASLVVRLLAELPVVRSGRWPLGDLELRLYRGRLECVANAGDRVAAALQESHAAPVGVETLQIDKAGVYPLLRWNGLLQVEAAEFHGVPMAALGRLRLQSRSGAERFQSAAGRPPRSLKKQFQQAGVPVWERGAPLFYSGEQLVFVPGLGLDARALGRPGERLARLRWLPAAAPGSRPIPG